MTACLDFLRKEFLRILSKTSPFGALLPFRGTKNENFTVEYFIHLYYTSCEYIPTHL